MKWHERLEQLVNVEERLEIMTAKARLLDKMVDALCEKCETLEEDLFERIIPLPGAKPWTKQEWRIWARNEAEGVNA